MDERVALFDLDRTITRHGTYTPFLIYVAWRAKPWRLILLPLAVFFMIGYKFGLLSRGRLKCMMMALLIGRMKRERLTPYIARFVEGRICSGLRPGARTHISSHKDAGDRLVLATASFDFYAEEFGRRLGFHQVIATRSLWDEKGRIRFQIDGENCYGPIKLQMIKDAGLAPEKTTFYSDDASDLPTFLWAGTCVVVNPKAKFKARAEALGFLVSQWS